MGTSVSPCFEGQYNGEGGGVRHGRGWLALPDGGSLCGDWVAGALEAGADTVHLSAQLERFVWDRGCA